MSTKESPMYTSDVEHIVAQALAAERKRMAELIRTALARREEWTSGPEALELLAVELERE